MIASVAILAQVCCPPWLGVRVGAGAARPGGARRVGRGRAPGVAAARAASVGRARGPGRWLGRSGRVPRPAMRCVAVPARLWRPRDLERHRLHLVSSARKAVRVASLAHRVGNPSLRRRTATEPMLSTRGATLATDVGTTI